MVKENYQAEFTGKEFAKAIVKNKPASLKFSTELCREIKNIPLAKAELLVKNIQEGKDFLPLRKYNKKVAHRKGDSKSNVKSGRFPEKTAGIFLELINNVKANANLKGLDEEKLFVTHAFASQGFSRAGYQPNGRIGGKRRRKKSVHLEIVVLESKGL